MTISVTCSGCGRKSKVPVTRLNETKRKYLEKYETYLCRSCCNIAVGEKLEKLSRRKKR